MMQSSQGNRDQKRNRNMGTSDKMCISLKRSYTFNLIIIIRRSYTFNLIYENDDTLSSFTKAIKRWICKCREESKLNFNNL